MEKIKVGVSGQYEFVIFSDEKRPGVKGGNFKANEWTPRDLNAWEYAGNNDWWKLNGHTITLNNGGYMVTASAPAHSVNVHKLRLADESNTTRIHGANAYSRPDDELAQTRAHLKGILKVEKDSEKFRLEHICETTRMNTGMGLPCAEEIPNNNEKEVYAIVEIIRFK